VPLGGRPLVQWSIAALRECPSVAAVVIACPPGRESDLRGDDLTLVEGGETRAISVSNALREVETELVAIHDAARPLVTPELVEGVVATLVADPEAAGAIAATPITDTVKQASGGHLMPSDAHGVIKASGLVETTLDRSRLWAAQTPQVFRVAALREALAGDPERVRAATDEAMLVEEAGDRVLIHPSPPENLKVTTALDLRLAELLLADARAGGG
jgi:2-C-methyl-D-erythritol 4-phosphate cytidylyltransferase